MNRIVFHIDVNSAFLSWSAVKMLAEGSEIDVRTIPAVVGGDPNKRTGVVVAKSIPAKAYGINTGEPVSMSLRKCPNLVIVPPDFKTYVRFSRAFKAICREYSPSFEEFSIDECFIDMTGMEHVYPDIIACAYELKNRIKNELGFTVNVGIGSNKLLAKMASDFEKPDKVHTLFTSEIPSKFWPLPVGDLLFLGRSSAEKLQKMYIRTIGDLAHADVKIIQSILGSKAGARLHDSANGIDDSPVEERSREAKSYGHSITVEENVTDYKSADRLLLVLSDAASSRMRADGLKAGNVSVNIRDTKFKNTSHQRQLDDPTDITKDIYDVARVLLREMWQENEPLRLIGVSLSDVQRGEETQLSLFGTGTENNEKQRHIDAAVDTIRSKYGKGKILRGSALNTKQPKKGDN